MLWNIPKAVGSRHDFIKPSILEGNTHHLQHNSRHSMALHTPWHCVLRDTACSVALCIMYFANASVFYFIQSSQRVRELVSIGICATEGTGTHE